MASSFKANPNIATELGPAVTPAIQAAAAGIIAAAAGNSPSSHFSDSLEVLDVSEDKRGTVLTVGTRWPFGHLIEWGSVNNPPYAPLRKAVSSLGLKFEEA